MRGPFLILPIVIAVLVWLALQVPGERLEMQVLRWALFAAAGLFAALLASAVFQALFLTE